MANAAMGIAIEKGRFTYEQAIKKERFEDASEVAQTIIKLWENEYASHKEFPKDIPFDDIDRNALSIWYFSAAFAEAKLGNNDTAENYLQKAIKFDETNGEAHLLLSQIAKDDETKKIAIANTFNKGSNVRFGSLMEIMNLNDKKEENTKEMPYMGRGVL